MARQVKLFLIRHGETVDNVAQVYAGSRDSALTNHGFQQATRLGTHFEALGLRFTHFFSSHLQRAAKTAGLVRQAQLKSAPSTDDVSYVPDIVQLPYLMEQDFGFYEGKKFNEKEQRRETNKDEPGFVDVESKKSMAKRADAFLDEHLLPIFDDAAGPSDPVVAIVSHGIMLSTLWKRLLLRLPPKSVTLAPELIVTTPHFSLDHLGGWSNTGYLELDMSRAAVQETINKDSLVSTSASPKLGPVLSSTEQSVPVGEPHSRPSPNKDICVGVPAVETSQPAVATIQSGSCRVADDWTTLIKTINGKDHLSGFKRTRGGIGSAKHESAQKNIDTFFKRRKVE